MSRVVAWSRGPVAGVDRTGDPDPVGLGERKAAPAGSARYLDGISCFQHELRRKRAACPFRWKSNGARISRSGCGAGVGA
jgi:hypothetical protein